MSHATSDMPDISPRRTIADQLRPAVAAALDEDQQLDGPVALMFQLLWLSMSVSPATTTDELTQEIVDEIAQATPEDRTRCAQMCSAFANGLLRIRNVVIAVKADLSDADVSAGDAEVLPDGWLVVSMADKEIARLPFNPTRPPAEAQKMAEDILSEYVRLHVSSTLETIGVPESPAAAVGDGVFSREIAVLHSDVRGGGGEGSDSDDIKGIE